MRSYGLIDWFILRFQPSLWSKQRQYYSHEGTRLLTERLSDEDIMRWAQVEMSWHCEAAAEDCPTISHQATNYWLSRFGHLHSHQSHRQWCEVCTNPVCWAASVKILRISSNCWYDVKTASAFEPCLKLDQEMLCYKSHLDQSSLTTSSIEKGHDVWFLDLYVVYRPCLRMIKATSTPSHSPSSWVFLTKSIYSPVYSLVISFLYYPIILSIDVCSIHWY